MHDHLASVFAFVFRRGHFFFPSSTSFLIFSDNTVHISKFFLRVQHATHHAISNPLLYAVHLIIPLLKADLADVQKRFRREKAPNRLNTPKNVYALERLRSLEASRLRGVVEFQIRFAPTMFPSSHQLDSVCTLHLPAGQLLTATCKGCTG